MAEGERIPIILDEPAVQVGAPATDERGIVTTVEQDGTLRIVLPVREPCEPANAEEIAVCATTADAESAMPLVEADGKADPLAVRLGENASIAPSASAGNGPMGGSDVRAMVTLVIKF